MIALPGGYSDITPPPVSAPILTPLWDKTYSITKTGLALTLLCSFLIVPDTFSKISLSFPFWSDLKKTFHLISRNESGRRFEFLHLFEGFTAMP